MTTAHGCVSDKHHHHMEQYLPLSFPGEQSGRQDLPLKNRPHTPQGSRAQWTPGPTHTLATRSCNRLSPSYFWFAGSLGDSFVQEQSFELELHGSRKQKRHQEVNQEVAALLDLKPANNICCLCPQISLVPKQESADHLSCVEVLENPCDGTDTLQA